MTRLSLLARGMLSVPTLLLIVSAPAMADLPGGHTHLRPQDPPVQRQPAPPVVPPGPAGGNTVPMVIRVDPQAAQSVLKIPKRLLPAQVGLSEPSAAPHLVRNAVAAVALSLAIGSVFLIGRSRKSRAIVALIVFAGAVVAAATLSADIPGPGPRPHPPIPQPVVDNNGPLTLSLTGKVSGQVVVEFTDDANGPVRLVLAGNNVPAAPAPVESSRIELTPPAPAAAPAPAAPIR
jgi:hypothetical protein